MSLTKLFKAPIKLFRKEVITFLVIRRYDLGIFEDKLRYIAVRPSASISVLRQKVWHILDLPDFCEEIIILKMNGETVIPLIDLRKGNDPQHPFILEVWLPGKRKESSTISIHNMLTIGNGDEQRQCEGQSTNTICEGNEDGDNYACTCFCKYPRNVDSLLTTRFLDKRAQSTISNGTVALNKLRNPDHRRPTTTLLSDYKKWDLSCGMSSTSLFKLNGKRSRDNFNDILSRIQSDLSTLSCKLDNLMVKVERSRARSGAAMV